MGKRGFPRQVLYADGKSRVGQVVVKTVEQLLADKDAEIAQLTKERDEALARAPKPIVEHWCMCTKLGKVARNCKATCMICGGIDAYGMAENRPADKQKRLEK